MYSHYMDGSFFPLAHHGSSNSSEVQSKNRKNCEKENGIRLSADFASLLKKIFGGISNHFSVQNIDLGDILLMLIILLLLLEGDDLEMVITLGLMFLLGLND